jgi:hypothetical protein
LIATTFPNGAVPSDLAQAINTTPETEFPQAFARSLFSEDRYRSGLKSRTPVHVQRVTCYLPFFMAFFHAEGALRTAVREFDHEWEGRIWLSGDGREAGLGAPPFGYAETADPSPLGQVLQAVPGETRAPEVQPHQAVAHMKDFLVQNCTKIIRYLGRNNVSYVRSIKPSPGKVWIQSLVLCYIPFQTFALRVGGVIHEGKVIEEQSPPRFHVRCHSLSKCVVCGGPTTAASQVLCAICHRPAHRWGVFSPDSCGCKKCGAFVCRNHAVRKGGRCLCARCGVGGKPLRPRWLPHCLFGLSVSAVAVAVSLLVPVSQPAAGIGVALAGWIPLVGLMLRPLAKRKARDLVYKNCQARP